MNSAQSKTIIIDIESARINLPVSGGSLSLETLKQYCPQAKGLFYSKHGQTYGLNVTDGKFVLDKDVTEYQVYCKTTISKRKQNRVEEILNILQSGSSEVIEETSSNTTGVRKSKHRILHIGWLHETSNGKYNQMKKPVGGVRELKLNPNLEYNVQQIIDLAKEEFIKDEIENCMLLKSCNIRLGFFDRTPIDRFMVEDTECDLWTYAQKRNLPCKIKLYLLTSLKKKNNQVGDESTIFQIEEQYASKNSSSHSDVSQIQSKRSRPAVSYIQENVLSVSRDASSIQSKRSRQVLSSIQLNSSITSRHLSSRSNVSQIQVPNKTLLKTSSRTSCASSFIPDSENFNQIQVYYRVIKYSKYTGDAVTYELDRDGIYNDAFPEVANLVKSYYDPIDDGYEISRITLNNQDLLEISVNDKLEKTFIFPQKNPSLTPHSLLYDADSINGLSCGSYGLGAIPFCNDSCKPIFTWYKNDQIFKQGPYLYWIFIQEQPNEDNIWQCMIHCSAELEESNNINQILSTTNQIDNVYQHSDLSLKFLKKEEFKISKELLGAGTQGKVFKGNWLGTPIAVKAMNIFNMDMKLVQREIEISNCIRHPNIVQVMGISVQSKTLYILMELVNGSALSDIIFDDDSKKEYSLTVRDKHFICSQLCQPVNYLHQQKNPIIHRDIKPDNILVVRHTNVIKLTDLGLCKFNTMSTAMRSTFGNISGHLKGTPLFMAPELLLQTSEATIFSDIWAVACTIVEVYNESPVWDISGDNPGVGLKNLLLQRKTPNLKNIPNEIQLTIGQCFNYNFSERPLLSELIEQYAMFV